SLVGAAGRARTLDAVVHGLERLLNVVTERPHDGHDDRGDESDHEAVLDGGGTPVAVGEAGFQHGDEFDHQATPGRRPTSRSAELERGPPLAASGSVPTREPDSSRTTRHSYVPR